MVAVQRLVAVAAAVVDGLELSLDRDAYGALSAGFCVGLLRAMAAVEPLDDDDAPAPDTLPTTASFGEDDPPLPWRDGFGLEPLIRVDVAPAS